MGDRGPTLQRELRTPSSAAIAGILFAILLTLVLVLVRLSVPTGSGGAASWLTDSRRRTAVAVALNLVPFAGIAFLWFIGVVRDRIGTYEDRFFATVFLGSGLLFVAMLFVAAAVAGGLVSEASSGSAVPSDGFALDRRVTGLLLNIYAMRMAAVFTISIATIALRTKIMARWIAFLGYGTALVLLVTIGISPWVALLFPGWILLVSIDTLVVSRRRRAEAAATER
jgi:hypothetical protein